MTNSKNSIMKMPSRVSWGLTFKQVAFSALEQDMHTPDAGTKELSASSTAVNLHRFLASLVIQEQLTMTQSY